MTTADDADDDLAGAHPVTRYVLTRRWVWYVPVLGPLAIVLAPWVDVFGGHDTIDPQDIDDAGSPGGPSE